MRFFSRKKQSGASLIEAMVAGLVFTFGVLGILGLESKLLLQNVRAQQRIQASMLAAKLISTAAADQGNAACYVVPVANQVGCGSATALAFTNAWVTEVGTTFPATGAADPTATLNADNTLSVTISWKLRQDASSHSILVSGQVI